MIGTGNVDTNYSAQVFRCLLDVENQDRGGEGTVLHGAALLLEKSVEGMSAL